MAVSFTRIQSAWSKAMRSFTACKQFAIIRLHWCFYNSYLDINQLEKACLEFNTFMHTRTHARTHTHKHTHILYIWSLLHQNIVPVHFPFSPSATGAELALASSKNWRKIKETTCLSFTWEGAALESFRRDGGRYVCVREGAGTWLGSWMIRFSTC